MWNPHCGCLFSHSMDWIFTPPPPSVFCPWPRTFLHSQPIFFLFLLLFCFVRFEEDKEKEGRGQSSCLHLSVVCSVCAKAAKCFPVLPESVFQTLQSMLAKKRLKY